MAHSGGEALLLRTVKQHLESHPVTTQVLDLPTQLEANHGQVDDQVKFLAKGKGCTLFLTPTESAMVLSQQDPHVPSDDRCEEFIMTLTFGASQKDAPNRWKNLSTANPRLNTKSAPIKQSVIGMHFSSIASDMDQLPDILNSSIGNAPTK
jgi:hypothetical protein